MSERTLDRYFQDWESHVFGFGYGTGETHVLKALQTFLAFIPNDPDNRAYDYRMLETGLTPAVAWLLINSLCKHDILEYGVSPRYAWLTPHGERLKRYVCEKSVDELYKIVCCKDDACYCSPNTCNCGPNGYEEGKKCLNPFWTENFSG